MFDPHRYASRVIAHRGGAALATENSWEAFAMCEDHSFTYVETDAHVSRDGVVYLLHDPVLERVSNGRGPIAALDSTDIDRLRITDSAYPPVRLRDLLDRLQTLVVNIDAKEDAVVEPLVRTVLEAGAEERVVLASFSSKRLRRIRRLAPQIATSLGQAEITALVLRAAGAALPLPPAQPAQLSRGPARQAGQAQAAAPATPASPAPFGACRPLLPGHPVAVQIPFSQWGIPVLTRRLVALSHQRGWSVHVWTVNEPAKMRKALELGADAIITDEPVLAREVLGEDMDGNSVWR